MWPHVPTASACGGDEQSTSSWYYFHIARHIHPTAVSVGNTRDATSSKAGSPTPPLMDARTTGGLVVQQSHIPRAGCGLFAARAFRAGQCVCDYTGDLLRTAEAFRMPRRDKHYLMRVGPQCYVNAARNRLWLARYINDCRDSTLYNVEFVKYPALRKAVVVALRDIDPGEELYVNYGRWYWLGLCPERLKPKT